MIQPQLPSNPTRRRVSAGRSNSRRRTRSSTGRAAGKRWVILCHQETGLIVCLDCRPAVLRIHLAVHHVLPVDLLCPRSGPWFDLDHLRRCNGSLHLSDHVVCALNRRLGRKLIVYRKFCLRHPQMRDVCDIGQYLFWDSKIVWYLTAVMFMLNNTFIQV